MISTISSATAETLLFLSPAKGIILVDDKFEQDHDMIMEKVKSVTNQPIKYVFSTHYHADHSVFTDETSVFLGGKEVRAKYYGRGHTNGDALIYFPELRTVHSGDLMAGMSPLIDYSGGGSIVEWTKTLDGALSNWNFDTVIPGHGNVTDKAGLQTYRNNIEKLRNRVTGLIREGKTQDDIGKVLMAEYSWAPNSLNMQWRLPGFMVELKQR